MEVTHGKEYHGTFKKQVKPLIGLQSIAQDPESTECAEKVEAMLSTAVLHLADLWNMLMLEFSEGVSFDQDEALLTPVTEIPPEVLSAMRSKLEDSLEWCQLARSRLKDITKFDPPPRQSPAYRATTARQEAGNHWQHNQTKGSDLKLGYFATPSPRSQAVAQNV